MTEKQFPLVADDEVMLVEMPQMDLYDESDFISNIQGDYSDKNYLEWQPIVEQVSNVATIQPISRTRVSQTTRIMGSKKLENRPKTYAEQARAQAKADLKKKRSAAYLTSDVTSKARSHKVSTSSHVKPTAPFQKEQAGEYAKYSKRLKQSSYILADASLSKKQTKLSESSSKSDKNNYDFLKKSQVYNKQDRQKEKEISVAQELNLTNLSED